MKLKVLEEIPYFIQRPVIAELVGADENGYYSIAKEGLLIDVNLFLHVTETGVMVEKFQPREDGEVVVGVDHSVVVYPRLDCPTESDYDVAANMTVGEFFAYLVQLKEASDEKDGR
ncbi:hypothetical protein LC085_07630 [Bacillus tianshenii]|uniref:hypothetical protein n=1 Tax=Sutcliffiella tianshenii TaxID=1463404 RepID=UPI001CD7ACFF|nr:hypothetical protein [Bacillus tianshenii]MCA1319782.1 hypothetical protein [Bacillus tianshenii]